MVTLSELPTEKEFDEAYRQERIKDPSGCRRKEIVYAEFIASRVVEPKPDESAIRAAKREALEEVRGRIGVYTTREAIVSILAASIAALDPKCEHKNTALIYDNGAPIGHYRCLNPECQAVALAVPGEWQEAAK